MPRHARLKCSPEVCVVQHGQQWRNAAGGKGLAAAPRDVSQELQCSGSEAPRASCDFRPAWLHHTSAPVTGRAFNGI